MNQQQRFEYISKLEEENNNRRSKYEAQQAKFAIQQRHIALVTSFAVSHMTNILFSSLGLCKRNDK